MKIDLIVEAMIGYGGERCGHPKCGCRCCQAWDQLDALIAAATPALDPFYRESTERIGPDPQTEYRQFVHDAVTAPIGPIVLPDETLVREIREMHDEMDYLRRKDEPKTDNGFYGVVE